jgi:basic membrane protein A
VVRWGTGFNKRREEMKKIFVTVICIVVFFSLCGAAFAQKKEKKPQFKLAAVMAAPIQDADYGTLAYEAIEFIKDKYDIEVAYSEKTQVPDAERVYREYIDEGYNIIWLHGGQWSAPAVKIADEFPHVTFIGEVDDVPKSIQPNFWYMDRNYFIGFYPLGYLAALKTVKGKIGYIGGLDLPFAKGEVNAIKQALRDAGSKAEFHYVFTGDFNDTVKARQGAESLIDRDVDVILSALNMGNFGLFPAVLESKKHVYVCTSHTSKKAFAPAHYLTSDIYNYKQPLDYVVGKILQGEKTGVIRLEYGPDKAIWTEFPISNVSGELNAKVKQMADNIVSGKVKIIKKVDTIE